MDQNEIEFRRLLDKFVEGTITGDERKVIDKFFAENLHEALRENVDVEGYVFLQKRLKQGIDQRIFPCRHWSAAFIRVAASISVIALVSYIFFTMRSQSPVLQEAAVPLLVRSTERGQKTTIKLPDGSTVKLNSNSRIAFPEKFNGYMREVTLQGEGYFDIVKNPSIPFIVRTAHSSTQVLGTSFNVNEKNARGTEVTLVTGKIKVAASRAPETLDLKPSQQAVINTSGEHIDTASVDVSKFIEWKDNILTFNKMPMNEVVKKLEDWYGVDILVNNKAINACLITGRYESESLENVLESFRFMLKGDYAIEGKKVILTGKGCKK
jgi:transmembrane sensor